MVEGVTVIVAVTGTFVGLVAMKEAILPTPIPANPIEVLLLVQLNIVPATGPVKITGAVAVLLHTIWLGG